MLTYLEKAYNMERYDYQTFFLTKKLQVIYSTVSTTFYIKDLLEPVLNNIIFLNNIL